MLSAEQLIAEWNKVKRYRLGPYGIPSAKAKAGYYLQKHKGNTMTALADATQSEGCGAYPERLLQYIKNSGDPKAQPR